MYCAPHSRERACVALAIAPLQRHLGFSKGPRASVTHSDIRADLAAFVRVIKLDHAMHQYKRAGADMVQAAAATGQVCACVRGNRSKQDCFVCSHGTVSSKKTNLALCRQLACL